MGLRLNFAFPQHQKKTISLYIVLVPSSTTCLLHLTFAHPNTQTEMTKPQNEAVLLSFQTEQFETFSITKAVTSTIHKLLPSDQILHP